MKQNRPKEEAHAHSVGFFHFLVEANGSLTAIGGGAMQICQTIHHPAVLAAIFARRRDRQVVEAANPSFVVVFDSGSFIAPPPRRSLPLPPADKNEYCRQPPNGSQPDIHVNSGVNKQGGNHQ